MTDVHARIGPRNLILTHLRAATQPAHHALDAALGLLNADLSLDTYRHLLMRFHGFWRGWEPQMAALLHDEAFLGPRRRLQLLAADLQALGASADAIDALPQCPLTPLNDDREALGSLYVMEGSTLGGQVIRRSIERRFGAVGRASCAYFSGYGDHTGAMWRSFLLILDQIPAIDAERVGQGASATFAQLGWWLTQECEATRVLGKPLAF